MAHKFGDAFFQDMVDRGRRELGGVMFEGSNIAQPMYPLRGTYDPPKHFEAHEPALIGPGREEPAPELPRDDPGRDDRELGMERE